MIEKDPSLNVPPMNEWHVPGRLVGPIEAGPVVKPGEHLRFTDIMLSLSTGRINLVDVGDPRFFISTTGVVSVRVTQIPYKD